MPFETIEEDKEKKELPDKSKETADSAVNFTAADISELEVAEREDALVRIDELEKRSGLNLDETQEEIQEDINEAMFDGKPMKKRKSEDIEKRIAAKEVKYNKEKIKKHIASQEYLDKLEREDDRGSMNVYSNAEKMQRDRLENLETVKTHIVSDKELQEEYQRALGGKKGPGIFGKILGFYKQDKDSSLHDAYIPFDDQASFFETIPHELRHAATRGNLEISDKAYEILNDSYKKLGFLGLVKNKKDEYYGNPTERLVRKWAVDDEMERLGIKKYGEPFTREHFNKLMKSYKNKELSSDAMEFIKTTKPKFEYFEMIFNGIAANENNAEEKAA